MGKSSSAPPPPDAGQLAQQQAQANRITQYTPQGTLQFGSVGSNGQFVPGTGGAASQITESPFQQRYRMGMEDLALTAQTSAAPRIQNLPLSPIDTTQFPERRFNLDFSGVNPVPSSADFSEDAKRVEQATFDRALGLLNPQFEQSQRRLDTRLVNAGLPIGSEAYGTEMGNFQRERDDTLSRLAMDAVGAGRAEQSRLFGQALTGRQAQLGDQLADVNLQNTQRAAAINENQALRTGELGELAAMLGLQPVQPVQAQAFFAPSPVDVVGPANLAYQGALANYQNQQQQQQGLLGGLFGLGSAALGAGIRKWG